jgi:hypothetical protein
MTLSVSKPPVAVKAPAKKSPANKAVIGCKMIPPIISFGPPAGSSSTDPAVAVLDPALEGLLAQYIDQYNESQLEAKRLKGEEKKLQEEIAHYQRRIEDTPRGEQELALLTRDYDLSKANYQSLLDKKIQAS